MLSHLHLLLKQKKSYSRLQVPRSTCGTLNSNSLLLNRLSEEEAARADRQNWTGDLDGMIKRRLIRVLFGTRRAILWTVEGWSGRDPLRILSTFEEDLNKK